MPLIKINLTEYLRRLISGAIITGAIIVLGISCQTTDSSSLSVEESFHKAKEAYEAGSYHEAIEDLKEFRSRHPYAGYATEADLYIANSHFELREYPQASLAYQQFLILHPDHPKAHFALYRIGMTYWKEAPSAANREQEFTQKALKYWKRLKSEHPSSSYIPEINPLLDEGRERVYRSELYVIRYYYQQKKWLSCIYRIKALLESDIEALKARDTPPQAQASTNALAGVLSELTHEILDLGLKAVSKIIDDYPDSLPKPGDHLLTLHPSKEAAIDSLLQDQQLWKSLKGSTNKS